ncbi:MAG: ATP-binding protein [Desulfococcaceae bacterium]
MKDAAIMDDRDREIARLIRRIAGLEKTLQIVTGYSGRIEKNLKRLFEVVSDTMPVPMLISTEAGEILFSNGKAQEIFAYSEKDFHSLPAADLYEHPENRGIFMKMLADKGEVRGFAVSLKRNDGSVFPASFFSQPLVFEGQNCLLTVIHDLSEIRKEEEKRLDIERRLRQTHKMEAVGTMAGGIAHDFNNILAVIFGRLELAEMMLPKKSEAGKHIRHALRAAERAKEITRQILAFCRKTEEDLKPFHIKYAVAEAVKMIKSMTPSNIETKLRIESKSAIITGDPTQIHQIVMNLCSNANYVLRDRGGVIEIHIDQVSFGSQEKIMIPNLSPGDYVRLTVSDNGPGMDKNVLERVFDPFFTTKPAGEGTGMGLAVVHGIVQNHGGAVSVESQPGMGTSFHCYFPLIAQAECVCESARVRKTIQGGTENILFVDDEIDILDTCGQMLTDLGYHVTCRTDSHEALNLFKKNPDLFDLLITDNIMPKMSGREMASEMLKIRHDIPVIIITGRETDDKTFFEIGAAAVIQKPFTQNEIGTAVRETLDKNRCTANG